MLALLVILVFTATFLVAAVAVCVAAVIQRRRRPVAVPEGESFAESFAESGAESWTDSPALLKSEILSSLPIWQQLLNRLDFTAFLKSRIEEAGMRWSIGRVTLAMLLLASLFFAFFLDASWAPPGASLVGAWLGGSIPYWIIRYKRKRRLGKMEAQFPDALDSLARAMRAGHGLSSAVVMLTEETQAPLDREFRKLAEEQRLGLAWPAALENFARRVPILEVRLFVAAVVVQTRTGGRLTEVLEKLADTIRETAALRGEVKAISAQGRLTGSILTAMPLFIGGAMYLTNPGYINLLFTDPRGNLMVWCAAACIVIGHFAIRKIVDIKAPQ